MRTTDEELVEQEIEQLTEDVEQEVKNTDVEQEPVKEEDAEAKEPAMFHPLAHLGYEVFDGSSLPLFLEKQLTVDEMIGHVKTVILTHANSVKVDEALVHSYQGYLQLLQTLPNPEGARATVWEMVILVYPKLQYVEPKGN